MAGLAMAGLAMACAVAADATAPSRIEYRVVATYPHDRNAFTQGLVYAGGALYESTGLYGRSSLRRVELKSGKPELIRPLAAQYFGEGLTAFGERLIQLTWRSGMAFVYARADLRPRGAFRYATDGWGLTQDGEHLIMSDGSATLYFLDPDRFTEVRRIRVRDHRGPVKFLNELEFVGGDIFANVWQSPRIVRIDAVSGRVTGIIDLSALVDRTRRDPSTDVLNGIAYIPGSGRLLITGKLWPRLYAIELLRSD
jgi:glutamine cyclotransferase